MHDVKFTVKKSEFVGTHALL